MPVQESSETKSTAKKQYSGPFGPSALIPCFYHPKALMDRVYFSHLEVVATTYGPCKVQTKKRGSY